MRCLIFMSFLYFDDSQCLLHIRIIWRLVRTQIAGFHHQHFPGYTWELTAFQGPHFKNCCLISNDNILLKIFVAYPKTFTQVSQTPPAWCAGISWPLSYYPVEIEVARTSCDNLVPALLWLMLSFIIFDPGI